MANRAQKIAQDLRSALAGGRRHLRVAIDRPTTFSGAIAAMLRRKDPSSRSKTTRQIGRWIARKGRIETNGIDAEHMIQLTRHPRRSYKPSFSPLTTSLNPSSPVLYLAALHPLLHLASFRYECDERRREARERGGVEGDGRAVKIEAIGQSLRPAGTGMTLRERENTMSYCMPRSYMRTCQAMVGRRPDKS